MKHLKFLSRTVLVRNNVEEACRVLNRVLGKEGIFDQYRRTRYYEKPYQVCLKLDNDLSRRQSQSHLFICMIFRFVEE